MTESQSPQDRPQPSGAPGERRLARAPSERYGPAPADGLPVATVPSPGGAAMRGIAYGAITAVVGSVLIVVFGGAMAVSAGLLVVAASIGYVVAIATVAGAGGSMSSPARSRSAAVLAGLSVALGQVGLWLFARSEGGVLEPIDYLGQTFGVVVPVELLLAAGVAWWRAR
jgi:hypothetical protein